jgi:ABC-type branched-subunit amino acid transport system ATPase component
MADTIQIKWLAKSYGATPALDGPDLTVAPGEVHGLARPPPCVSCWASSAATPARSG